jgi:hypothetical protein
MSHPPKHPLSNRTGFDRIVRIAGTSLMLAVLAGCGAQEKSGQDPELEWAKAALERNPQFKVLSVDATQKIIKVRVVASGETIGLSPGELAALPISELVALTQKVQPAQLPPLPTEAPSSPAEVIAVPPPSEPAAPATAAPFDSSSYTVQREDGRVRVTGPGVSIESAPRAAATPAETAATRIDDPITCDGKRMLHIDNRTINVDGDAIVARGGCELHITNSRINASGTAITVLDATVHITNSELRGDSGSLTASSAARLFIRNNRFIGLARRSPESQVQELGGNSWR